jgi:predicted GNAT family N-acyltransferase
MPFDIKQPQTVEEFERYYRLRWEILRKPWSQPRGSEVDDMEEQCFHVMALDTDLNNDIVIGVGRLQYNSASEAQIRYMAVASEHRNKGIGQALIRTMENQAKAVNCNTVMLHARENATGFYTKAGYRLIGKSYLLFNQIRHYQMIKDL